MKKIIQMLGVLAVSLVLVGCATTTKLGSAGTLDAGFCMHDVPQWMAWLSCDEPLIDFKADILSTDEDGSDGSVKSDDGKSSLLYGDENLKILPAWDTQNNSITLNSGSLEMVSHELALNCCVEGSPSH